MTVQVVRSGKYLAGSHWLRDSRPSYLGPGLGPIEWPGGPATSLEWALSVETPCGYGLVARPSTRYTDREYCGFSR